MPNFCVCDLEILDHTLQEQVSYVRKLINDLNDAKIEVAYVQKIVNMNKEEILKIHKEKFKYWQGKNGNWNSYFPKENIKPPYGKLVSKVSQERLDKAILDFYLVENKKAISLTFQQVYREWREVKNLELVDNSVLRYNSDYKRFFAGTDFEDIPIDQINENTIKKFMLERIKESKLCRSACKKMFSYIKNTFRYARIEKYIPEDPAEYLELKHFSKYCFEKEKPIEEQVFNDTELSMILNGLKELYDDRLWYIPRYAVEFALLTGMRVGEIASLRWDDIQEDYIFIHSSVKHNRLKNEFYVGATKTKKSRQFPLCDEIRELLGRIQRVEKRYGLLCEYIFTDGKGSFINAQRISDCAKRLTNYLGIHGGGITALRKTINSNLRKQGVSATIASSILGHTAEVNEKYYTYDTSNLFEKQKIIEVRNSKIATLT